MRDAVTNIGAFCGEKLYNYHMADVSIVKCNSYSFDEVYRSIVTAIDKIGGIGLFVKPGQKVLLKPNILAGHKPEAAVTTHPEIVRAVIRIVKEAGGIPFIGESPGYGSLERFSKPTGIKQVSIDENVPLIEFVTPKDVSNPNGQRFKNLTIAAEVFEYDVLINLPKFKSHALTGTTGAVKNLFGCVPGILKSQYHFKLMTRALFIQFLEDLARYINPKLSIMDSVWAMEGEGGPASGTPKFMGIVAASSDPFVLDQAFIKMINGEAVQGFSFPDYKQIANKRDSLIPIPFVDKYLKRWFAEKPVINRKKCVNCGVCIKVCAAKALSKEINTPKYDYDKCIRCFCCQEMCPEKAIYIEKNFIATIVSSILSRF